MRYYRVLSTPDHDSHFERQEENSYWGNPPGEWIDIWAATGSTDHSDYPLFADGRQRTQRSRIAFIDSCVRHQDGSAWDNSEYILASEMVGLCVFAHPEQALRYAEETLYYKRNKDRYVVVEGRVNCTCAEPGSVLLIDWTVYDGPMSRADFVAKCR